MVTGQVTFWIDRPAVVVLVPSSNGGVIHKWLEKWLWIPEVSCLTNKLVRTTAVGNEPQRSAMMTAVPPLTSFPWQSQKHVRDWFPLCCSLRQCTCTVICLSLSEVKKKKGLTYQVNISSASKGCEPSVESKLSRDGPGHTPGVSWLIRQSQP